MTTERNKVAHAPSTNQPVRQPAGSENPSYPRGQVQCRALTRCWIC